MATLIRTAIMSLDGDTADADGRFGWAAPDEEVHAFVNDLGRPVGTYRYGRRMYEAMRTCEAAHLQPDQPDFVLAYASIWQAADKVVDSTTLEEAPTARTWLERPFAPAAVRRLKEEAQRDISVSGPHLAAPAVRAGLVDEWRPFLAPIVVGGGNRYVPDGVRQPSELLEERRFRNGVVYLRYRSAP